MCFFFFKCSLMECIMSHATLAEIHMLCLLWATHVAAAGWFLQTLLFGRGVHQGGSSSPSTAVNMGETQEIINFKEKLPEIFSLEYC